MPSQIPSLHCYREHLLPGSIRLLRLSPNESPDATIQCELFHYSLQNIGDRAHPYDALSYVWGDSKNLQSIFVREHGCTSGDNLPVTQNLHKALLRLRHQFIERIIWIDAVCINQNDDREKEKQIQLMAKVYGHANRVIVWLGEAADDSNLALQEIRIAGGKKSADSFVDERTQRAVLALLRRPWFRRIWVLQEVAAARHILVVCGPTEIDGYAFCSGVDIFRASFESYESSQGSVQSVSYLIRGAIYRPPFSPGQSSRTSLGICPLGELVDMYHTHEATKTHDKIYALLGMSSDNPEEANLLPNYEDTWEMITQRLARFLLGESVYVKSWKVKNSAVIMGKGCVLGRVSLIQKGTIFDDRQIITVVLNDIEDKQVGEAHWDLQPSAKPIRNGDMICLLQGASSPTIIRLIGNYFFVILVAAAPLGGIQYEGEYIKWPKVFQWAQEFTRDFTLVWDWESNLEEEQLERLEENGTSIHGYEWKLDHLEIDQESYLDEVMRVWDVSLILGDGGDYNNAELSLKGAIKGYERAIGVEGSQMFESTYGLTPLAWAAGNGFNTVVHLLLAKYGVDPDLKDSQYSWPPLLWAACRGHETAFKLLLLVGKVDVDAEDTDERTALWCAASNGHRQLVETLLTVGNAEADTQDRHKQTALSCASENGHHKVVKLLLETSRVSINARCSLGRTPLSWAAENGHEKVVNLLLGNENVDVNARDEHHRTALWWASEKGQQAVVSLLLRADKVDVDAEDENGQTPLFRAAENGHKTVVKLLLKTGKADADAKDSLANGQTPLLEAVENEHEAVVKLLLQTDKVDVNAKGKHGWTPLFWGVIKGNEAISELLLQTGKADIDEEDDWGQTPLWWAVKTGHEALVKLLQ